MSLRRAARVFACLATVSLLATSVVRAEDPAAVEQGPELATKVYQVADLIVPLTASETSRGDVDFDWLIDLIELRTGADCWTHSGGLGALTSHKATLSLVVRQTQATHQRIADLLDEVRGTLDLALCVEIQLIHGRLEDCTAEGTHRPVRRIVDAAGKQRLLQAVRQQPDSAIHFAPKVTFFNGTTASVETTDGQQTRAVNLRGVISRDNRYARLWIETQIDGDTCRAEVLIPEGFTAVRQLAGENSWMLITSHVINAEEPEVMIPVKSVESSPSKTRYLVPSDDSPDPRELTALPQFKAGAERFGETIIRRAARIASIELCEATAVGEENACSLATVRPGLAPLVERVDYQVAMAEPSSFNSDSCDPPGHAAVVTSLDSVLSGEVTLQNCTPGFVRCFTFEPEVLDPPARLNVFLDDCDLEATPMRPLAPGKMSEHVFVPKSPTEFPLPRDFAATSEQRAPVRLNRNADHFLIQTPSLAPGRRAIFSNPTIYPHAEYGVIVEQHVIPSYPLALPDRFGLEFRPLLAPPSERFPPRERSIQRVSSEQPEPAAVRAHLEQAASELAALGLNSEASTVRAIIDSMSRKAQQRSDEIDLEIARLRAQQTRLQALSKPQTVLE